MHKKDPTFPGPCHEIQSFVFYIFIFYDNSHPISITTGQFLCVYGWLWPLETLGNSVTWLEMIRRQAGISLASHHLNEAFVLENNRMLPAYDHVQRESFFISSLAFHSSSVRMHEQFSTIFQWFIFYFSFFFVSRFTFEFAEFGRFLNSGHVCTKIVKSLFVCNLAICLRKIELQCDAFDLIDCEMKLELQSRQFRYIPLILLCV